jgi:hypothetical protein
MRKDISRKRQSATAGTYLEGCTVGLDVSDEFTYAAVITRPVNCWPKTGSGRGSRSCGGGFRWGRRLWLRWKPGPIRDGWRRWPGNAAMTYW